MSQGELVSFPKPNEGPGVRVSFFRNFFGRSFPMQATQLLLCYLSSIRHTSDSIIAPRLKRVVGSPDVRTYRPVLLNLLAVFLTAGFVLLSAVAARGQV